jgi:stalled ribosome rescue protein Dom34
LCLSDIGIYVFAEAESLAKALKASRSEVYSRALSEFLGRHAPDRITEQMDRVVTDVGEGSDKFVEGVQNFV